MRSGMRSENDLESDSAFTTRARQNHDVMNNPKRSYPVQTLRHRRHNFLTKTGNNNIESIETSAGGANDCQCPCSDWETAIDSAEQGEAIDVNTGCDCCHVRRVEVRQNSNDATTSNATVSDGSDCSPTTTNIIVTLPYSRDAFGIDVQMRFKQAVAKIASVEVDKVTITTIVDKPYATRRTSVHSLDILFSVIAASASAAMSITRTIRDTLNSELKSHGVLDITAIKVYAENFCSRADQADHARHVCKNLDGNTPEFLEKCIWDQNCGEKYFEPSCSLISFALFCCAGKFITLLESQICT